MYTHIGITDAGYKTWSRGPWLEVEYPVGRRRIEFADVDRSETVALFPRPIDVGGLVVVAFKGHNGALKDRCVVCNSLGNVRVIDGKNEGNGSHGLRIVAGQLELVQTSPDELLEYRIDPVTLDGDAFKRTTIAALGLGGFPAEGFLELAPDPVWTHLRKFVVIDGVRFFYPVTKSDRTVALHDDLFGLVRDHVAGKTYRVWEGQSQVPPQISRDGTAVFSADVDPSACVIVPATYLGRPEKELQKPDEPDEPDHPEDPDEPEDPTVEPKSLLPEIEEARRRYGAKMTSDQCVEMLNRVLWEAPDKRWRLFGKSPGQAHGVRYDGVRVSHDFLIHTDGLCVDCLTSAGGTGSGGPSGPTWGMRPQVAADGETDTARWVAPIKPQDVPDEPDNPDNPDEPDPDAGQVLERLTAIERAIGDLTGAVEALRQAQTQALGGVRSDVREIGALAQAAAASADKAATRPFPPYSGRVGLSLRLLPEKT